MLQGQPNTRDLGGLIGRDGRRTLGGRIFRSGELSALTTSDLDTVAGLGIEQVIDLRTAAEAAAALDRLPAGLVSYAIPLDVDLGLASDYPTFLGAILAGAVDASEFMHGVYRLVDDQRISAWRQIFGLLETGRPTLFHCSAGKDRTGMTTALLLTALGVSRADIVKDYLAANDYLHGFITGTITYIDGLHGPGTGERLRPFLEVRESYLLAFFDALESRCGSVDGFLDELGGNRGQLQRHHLEERAQDQNACGERGG